MSEQDSPQQSRRQIEERIAEGRSEPAVGKAYSEPVPEFWVTFEAESIEEFTEFELLLPTTNPDPCARPGVYPVETCEVGGRLEWRTLRKG